MQTKPLTLSLISAITLFTLGCGESSTTPKEQPGAIGTAYYIDSPIEGISYKCGTQNGTTDQNGAFHFEKGKECQLFLGDILFKEIPSNLLEDGHEIFESNLTKAALLQTLDNDGDAENGITIHPDVIKQLQKEQITTLPKSEAEITALWNTLKNTAPSYQGRIIDFAQAARHLEQSRVKMEAKRKGDTNKHAVTTTQPVIAYYGDKENNRIVVVNTDTMQLIDEIYTGHKKTYAAEAITLSHRHQSRPKMYIDNRGSDAIDVLDSQTNTIVKTIALPFYPRSISLNKDTGLAAISSTNKPMTAIIDTRSDTLVATVGKDQITYPTSSGHSYVSSGTLACGHPQWLDDNHFVLIDRQNRSIVTYKIAKDSTGNWQTTLINTITTPSPVHNLIPPKIHGKAGHTGKNRAHKGGSHQKGGKHQNIQSRYATLFYATAEGAEGIYPSVLALEFTPDEGLRIVDNLEIKKEGLSADIMGVHHLNFLKNQRYIYVGSDEGNLFIVDYNKTPMQIVKTITAGKGAGHTDEFKHGNIAVVINHKDRFITLVNTATNTKIADIDVSEIDDTLIGKVQTQSHPQYHFSRDGRYFYLFLTEEGALVKVDLVEKHVVERVEIGGKLAMGTFLEH